MATMNISLPHAMKAWVGAQTESGKYSNASDYVRDLIRQDQEYRESLQRLQSALDDGVESGVSDRAVDDIWSDLKARHSNAR
tara:strand:+ start:407 stop:652 length:246 start_codon:yes stop_codon:yes gene_type:complete